MNPMMYTLTKFESEEAARNQTEHLQTLHRGTFELRKKNVQQYCVAKDLKHIWVTLLESSYIQ